jgi:hypothetical protein
MYFYLEREHVKFVFGGFLILFFKNCDGPIKTIPCEKKFNFGMYPQLINIIIPWPIQHMNVE